LGLLQTDPNDVDLKSPEWKQITDHHRQVDHFVKERMETLQPLIQGANRVLDCERCPRWGRLTAGERAYEYGWTEYRERD
jgi:hypothetical protein